MGELANQWYLAGNLLLQAGFLIAAVWSVRAILGSVKASQDQMRALLKLAVSGGASGEENSRPAARPTPYLLDGWPEPQNAVPTGSGPKTKTRVGMLSGLGNWLQAPIVSSGVSPWRKAVRWLQAPAGT